MKFTAATLAAADEIEEDHERDNNELTSSRSLVSPWHRDSYAMTGAA
jgi:hypothetical protein